MTHTHQCQRPEVSPDVRSIEKEKRTAAGDANVVRLFEGLEGLLLSFSSVHLMRISEPIGPGGTSDEESGDWSATLLPDPSHRSAASGSGSGKKIVAQASSLIELLARLVDGSKKKVCAKCREVKLLTGFSIDRSKEDGRCRSCRRCESQRVMSYQKRKKKRATNKVRSA